MTDSVIKVKNSFIQHGSLNDRVYLMKLDPKDCPSIVDDICSIARDNNYSKITGKIPISSYSYFFKKGFIIEARIPGLFREESDGVFVSRFCTGWRSKEEVISIVQGDQNKNRFISRRLEKEDVSVEKANPDDAESIAELFYQTFSTYPFPIHDSEYLKSMMEKNVRYFLIRKKGKIISCSSSEIDNESLSAEMTDFATEKGHQGKGYASILLRTMEKDCAESGIRMVYTICRAGQPAVNELFRGASYHYGGRLIRNTQICGNFESMNVWYRKL